MKKNQASIAGKGAETARPVRHSPKPSTGQEDSQNSCSPVLSPNGKEASIPSRRVEAFCEPTESVVVRPRTSPTDLQGEPNLDEVIEALDDAFDSACFSAPGADLAQEGFLAHDDASLQELFSQIAAIYSIPLKNFIFALQHHTAPKNIIEFCCPILHSIRRAAESINLSEAVLRIECFEAALAEGQSSPDRFLKDNVRRQILDAYDALAAVLPEIFQMGKESQEREDIIIHSLLQGIPGVSGRTFAKLYRAGLGSLNTLFLANSEDLAAATGIQQKLCTRICQKIEQYRQETQHRASLSKKSGSLSHLTDLVNKLHKLVGGENAGIGAHSPLLGSRRMSRQRHYNQAFLEVNIILAELGELDLIHQLQKGPLKKRIKLLQEYLSH